MCTAVCHVHRIMPTHLWLLSLLYVKQAHPIPNQSNQSNQSTFITHSEIFQFRNGWRLLSIIVTWQSDLFQEFQGKVAHNVCTRNSIFTLDSTHWCNNIPGLVQFPLSNNPRGFELICLCIFFLQLLLSFNSSRIGSRVVYLFDFPTDSKLPKFYQWIFPTQSDLRKTRLNAMNRLNGFLLM